MNRSVLIIDDEVILARNLARALERLDIKVRIANSYEQALQILDNSALEPPGLVCADIRLGDGSGLDIAQVVRLRYPDLPVLVMTGQDTVANRSRAEGLSAQAFLSKPFSLSHFRELVVTLVPATGDPSAGDPSTPAGRRVLMYSHDTIGLGHMRRNIAIARVLAEQVENISILLLAGCPGGALPDLPNGVDLIKLPSLAKVGRDHWRPGSLRIGTEQLRTMRAGLIRQAVKDFSPDVVLVDHEPAGVWGELLEPLSVEEHPEGSAAKPLYVLGLRDILDQPDVVLNRWRRGRIDQLIADCYHTVLIYGCEQVYPSATAYGITGMPGVRSAYCGYVTTKLPQVSRVASSERRIARVVICGGGGRDAFPVMHAALDALEGIELKDRPVVTMVAGPLMDPELSTMLARRAHDIGVNFMRRSDNLPALMASVDLVITMGGYNSMVEAVNSGAATLVVPRVGPSAEQRLRAELFSRLGLVTTISMESDLVGELRLKFLALKSAATTRTRGNGDIQFDGAKNAAAQIASLLASRLTPQQTSSNMVINA